MPGVTKEQIQAAREADLFAWLQSHEPGVLKRDGPNYRHKEHDSLVYVTGKRYWYWNSRGRSINALDYLIQIRGYGLVDAVQALAGGEIRQTPAYQSAAAKQAQREPEKKPFTLPWARRCATAAVSYLQRRGISSDVISRCFRNGLFYEARYHGEPVCVFVGKDNAGKAKFAWYVTWDVYVNSPKEGYGEKIAGQNQKRYTDKAAAMKYLDGRKKAYSHLFTEISPQIPKEYEHHFTVHGTLLPGYTVEGQEPVKAEHTAAEVSEGDISLPEKAEKPSVLGKLAAAKLDAKESGQPVRQGEKYQSEERSSL